MRFTEPVQWRFPIRLLCARDSRRAEFARFLVVGAVNTLVTFLIYLALLTALPYPAAYTISYAAGIVISYTLNARLVFNEPWSIARALQYPLVYVCQYLLGLVLLYIFVEAARLPKAAAPLLVVALTVPVTFVLSRYLIKRSP